jgi:hypothetical protein
MTIIRAGQQHASSHCLHRPSPPPVAGRFILTWESRITANRYVRLAAFSMIMTLTTMVFVGFSLELAFYQSPHQTVRSFTAVH